MKPSCGAGHYGAERTQLHPQLLALKHPPRERAMVRRLETQSEPRSVCTPVVCQARIGRSSGVSMVIVEQSTEAGAASDLAADGCRRS
jgi:hypothetical protein